MNSLKSKIILILLCLFATYGFFNYCIQNFIILPSFKDLEQQEGLKDLDRIVQALNRETYHLDSLVHDWSAWADTYEFATSVSENYITSNLNQTTFETNKVNLIAIYNKEGKRLWGETRNYESGELIEMADFAENSLPQKHPLLAFDTGKPLRDITVAGIFLTGQGPMLIASRPILTSENGGPLRGAFIMGKYLDDAMIKILAEQTQVSFHLFSIGASLTADKKNLVQRLLSGASPLIDDSRADLLVCSAIFPGITESSNLVIRAEIPRGISAKGTTTIRYAIISTIAAGMLILVTMLLLLRWSVLKPLSRLAQHAVAVGISGDLSARLSMSQKDEIGNLARVFDQMVERLAKTMGDLEESEELYRVITEHSLALLLLIQEGRIIYANKKALEGAGFTLDEIIGMEPWQGVYHEDCDMIKRRALARATGESPPDHYECRYLTKQGDIRWIEILAVPITYKGKPTTLVHGIDITERKNAQLEQVQLESQLQRAQKMEAIGTLAGGVAHDLNNILCGVVTYPEVLLFKMSEHDPLRKPLMNIKESGEKAARIVQDLLTLARRGVAISEVVDFNDIVNHYLASPEHAKTMSFHPHATIEVRLEEKLLYIKGSPVHLSKTLMNLVSNAAEAMQWGGVIAITTENKYIEKPVRGYEDVEEGDYVVLTVSDTGSGISPDDLNRIFEPFYTKKIMGRSGTGLGMSVVWSTIKDHNGYIDVQSAEGRGTTFTLFFPATREAMMKPKNAVSMETLIGKGEKILVVDDVKTQRDIALQMLTNLGYSVITVASGELAIEHLKSNRADLVVLDMIMDPGIDGLETYKRILEIHPGQRAIIVSGYSETERARQAEKLGAAEYVLKPYSIEKLGLAIRKGLSSS